MNKRRAIVNYNIKEYVGLYCANLVIGKDHPLFADGNNIERLLQPKTGWWNIHHGFGDSILYWNISKNKFRNINFYIISFSKFNIDITKDEFKSVVYKMRYFLLEEWIKAERDKNKEK